MLSGDGGWQVVCVDVEELSEKSFGFGDSSFMGMIIGIGRISTRG